MAYSEEELNKRIDTTISRILLGESLVAACKRDDTLSRSYFFELLEKDKSLADRYAHACKERQEILFEQIQEIADTPIDGIVVTTDDKGRTTETKGDMIAHRRLQIDARKWMLGKMNPKKYGDKTINENHNTNTNVELSKDEFKELSNELDGEY